MNRTPLGLGLSWRVVPTTATRRVAGCAGPVAAVATTTAAALAAPAAAAAPLPGPCAASALAAPAAAFPAPTATLAHDALPPLAHVGTDDNLCRSPRWSKGTGWARLAVPRPLQGAHSRSQQLGRLSMSGSLTACVLGLARRIAPCSATSPSRRPIDPCHGRWPTSWRWW